MTKMLVGAMPPFTYFQTMEDEERNTDRYVLLVVVLIVLVGVTLAALLLFSTNFSL